MMVKYDIALIEDDIYGDLYFTKQRPANCKTFDKNTVMYCCVIPFSNRWRHTTVLAGRCPENMLGSGAADETEPLYCLRIAATGRGGGTSWR